MKGPFVIFAGPGSGKTTVLTCRAAYMMQVGKINPKELLIVTFTRAAAEEMRIRLAQLPGVGNFRAKACEIGTFHSVFLRILLKSLGQVPKLMEETEQRQLIRTVLRNTESEANDEDVAELLQKIGLCKNNLIMPERIRAVKRENMIFRERFFLYENMKKEKGWWDYDDILVECHHLLTTDPQILAQYQRKYQYILVDEFQDTNYAQYEILKRLAASRNLCIVGDDDQSIYRFRGSRVEYLLDFEHTFPEASKLILATNYRSTHSIIEASKRLISHNRKRQEKHFKGVKQTGEEPVVIRPTNEKDEAEHVINDMEEGIKKGVAMEQHAVLYRTNIQARSLVDLLVERNIPFTIYDSEADFYRRWQVRDVLSYLRLSQNGNDGESLAQIINRPKRYMYDNRWLEQLYQISRKHDTSLVDSMKMLQGLEIYQLRKLKELIQQLKRLKDMDPEKAVSFIRREIGYDTYIEEYVKQTGNDKKSVFDPLDDMVQAVREYKTIPAFLDHVERVQESLRKARNSGSGGIQLMTLHRAKGLEFHTVYIIGVVHHMLPHEKAISGQQTEDAWEEERRLFYVGMTRAKTRLLLSAPERYMGKKVKPSPFLYETGLFNASSEKASLHSDGFSPQERMKKAVERYSIFNIQKGDSLVHREFGICTVYEIQELRDGSGRRVTLLLPGKQEAKHLHLELSMYLGIIKPVSV